VLFEFFQLVKHEPESIAAARGVTIFLTEDIGFIIRRGLVLRLREEREVLLCALDVVKRSLEVVIHDKTPHRADDFVIPVYGHDHFGLAWSGCHGRRGSASGRIVVSKDGKSRTVTTSGTNPEGKKVSGTAVYDKQ
jgi:hypothetical protein